MLQHRICLYVKICDTNATNKKGLYLNACLNNKEVHWLHQMNFEQHFVAVNKCTCFINIWQHYRWPQTHYLTRLPSSEMMFYHHTVSQNSCKNDISTKRLISLNNQTNKIMVMLLITRSTVGFVKHNTSCLLCSRLHLSIQQIRSNQVRSNICQCTLKA